MGSVAVFLNPGGFAALPEEAGTVRVYAKNPAASWEVAREHAFSMLGSPSISDLRKAILAMVQGLGGCKIFAACKVTGQLYSVLEANGFTIYEAEGKPEQFLDSILASETEADRGPAEKEPPAAASGPEKTGMEGFYFMNLKAALNSDPNLSSKKALMPFLEERNFKVLEVVCDHIPRWFDAELEKLGLNATVSELEKNGYRVTVTAR